MSKIKLFERFYKEIKLLILDNLNSTTATIRNSPIFMTAFTCYLRLQI